MMSDLINRQELLDNLNACLAESDGGTPITDAVIVAIKCAVEQMQTVDAVPVVRCKDCVMRGCCRTEDSFNFARITDGYCRVGWREERRNDLQKKLEKRYTERKKNFNTYPISNKEKEAEDALEKFRALVEKENR